MKMKRTDEAYREWLYYRFDGMSHTVASRELVYQVPIQKQRRPPLYSLRDFVPQAPCEQNVENVVWQILILRIRQKVRKEWFYESKPQRKGCPD